MKIVKIKDSNFDFSIRKPKNFIWVDSKNYIDNKTFVTDEFIPHFKDGIAWLVEPPAIKPTAYEWIKKNNNRYSHILTYSQDLLNIGENFLYYPFGNTLLKDEQFSLYEDKKNKLISFIFSNKNWTSGHNLRQKCKEVLPTKVDLLGSGVDGKYTPKIISLINYKFQIVIENSKYEYYFTEKLLDCFLTGVIPIYWGCEEVDNIFDSRGIIRFNNENELAEIVESIDDDLYKSKIEYIKNNFEIAKKYTFSENWIYDNYTFLFN